MNCDENMESNIYFHIQDEAERLLKEIELMKKNVENSELYAGMRFDLEHNETFQQCLFRLLGSHSHVQVVIYALGSMEYSFHSQFQLAVVLLLKRDFSNWIGNIQVYDPLMSPADMLVFRKLDVEMLTIDENCKRQVQRPTMFYMPLPSYWLIGNLLGANWSSSCINQIFLLTNSFRNLLTNISSCNQNGETSQRVERILPFTTEFDIKTSHEEIYTNVFSRFSWHFFDVGSNVNMETSLPVTKITKYERSGGDRHWLDWQRYLEEVFLEVMQSDMSSEGFAQFLGEHRGPRRLRCNSVLPPLGWIKLNIYGIGTEGDQPGRFSGVFQDDTGICLGKYCGTIDANDNVIAGLEALRNGLVRCVEGKPKAQKLMVESDNVILIQYLNGHPEPNELTMCRLNEISDLLKRITCAFYHVYEEANEAARDLALRDERHNRA
ncbi:hypothetical protein R3W88_029169 [Solanum pinnatisectum]|uniref:RNase H type-1 domain-containing protein n=1 Tax=Solanum pinnatisectum TaxID=50273 RepID=A0AAV9K6H3_9SOLN|nr:hypothetical protein R3W88_029169 [Solanum pinnatisectum]